MSMSRAARLFSLALGVLIAAAGGASAHAAQASETGVLKKQRAGFYSDIFDQNAYYEGTTYLRLNRLGRALARKPRPAADVNVYDEVPDSSFFTNRHGRERMTAEALARGTRETEGPDVTSTLTIVRGKFEGLHPGFFVRDSRGDEYLFKFDASDYLELNTGAEAVVSRFFYAIGYNVPQYTIEVFSPDKLVPAPDAMVIDDTGFKKEFTKEKLEEYLLFIPWDSEGRFRASASKILKGENLGVFRFKGRRKKDPLDPVDHELRREIRALRVFGAWLNNTDLRESNTLDMRVTENGRSALKHYLIDFNCTLGGESEGAKPPMTGHEYLLDIGEITKAFVSFGFWEKPWQKRWREAGEKVSSPAVGYLDNRHFEPAKFKNQLPYYAFKDLTRADGLWAAKIVMAFTDEDIRAVVKAGKYSNPKDEDAIASTLIERRDAIGRYWFGLSSPLDRFRLEADALVFDDLAVAHGFEKAQGTVYRAEIWSGRPGRRQRLGSEELREPKLAIRPEWKNAGELEILLRAVRPAGKPKPWVRVVLRSEAGGLAVASVRHQD